MMGGGGGNQGGNPYVLPFCRSRFSRLLMVDSFPVFKYLPIRIAPARPDPHPLECRRTTSYAV